MKPVSTCTALALVFVATFALHGCDNSPPPAAPAPLAAAPAAESAPPAVSSQAATDATFQDLQGNPVELTDYTGKKVFVNYWATWCAPCIRELPAIARAAATLEAENFVFLLASDESLAVINDFLLDREFTGNFIKLNKFVGSRGMFVMPTSVLYDDTGAVIRSWEGPYEWDSAEMLAQLRAP